MSEQTNKEETVEYNGCFITLKYFDGEKYGWSYKVNYFPKGRRNVYPIKDCGWCKNKYFGEDKDKALEAAKAITEKFNPSVQA